MNKHPISEEERVELRAQHRERVRRCNVDLRKLYAERDEAERLRKEEEEYFNE